MNGLTLVKQLNGFWRGAPAKKRKSLQDVLIYEKKVDLPEKFDSETYIAKYQDVRCSGMSGSFHYLSFGKDENRSFDAES